MRDLDEDLKTVVAFQEHTDLSDTYLKKCSTPCTLRTEIGIIGEYTYGISFVESTIAREWLERAINAENELNNLTGF